MFAAIGAGLFFAATSYCSGWTCRTLWLAGGILCQLRLLCNLFDGMVAVHIKKSSPTGELYNEVPDRVSDAAVLIGLGFSATGAPTFGFIAAVLAVFVAYVRAMANSIGAPNDFCGPMAKPQRMALVTILAVYMAAAPVNWMLSIGEANVILLVIAVGCLITAARRLVRSARFLEKESRDND